MSSKVKSALIILVVMIVLGTTVTYILRHQNLTESPALGTSISVSLLQPNIATQGMSIGYMRTASATGRASPGRAYAADGDLYSPVIFYARQPVVNEPTQLYFYNTTSGTEQQLTYGSHGMIFASPIFSSTSQLLAYTTQEQGDNVPPPCPVYVRGLDVNSPLKVLSEPNICYSAKLWSADGQTLLLEKTFSTGVNSGGVNLVLYSPNSDRTEELTGLPAAINMRVLSWLTDSALLVEVIEVKNGQQTTSYKKYDLQNRSSTDIPSSQFGPENAQPQAFRKINNTLFYRLGGSFGGTKGFAYQPADFSASPKFLASDAYAFDYLVRLNSQETVESIISRIARDNNLEKIVEIPLNNSGAVQEADINIFHLSNFVGWLGSYDKLIYRTVNEAAMKDDIPPEGSDIRVLDLKTKEDKVLLTGLSGWNSLGIP